MKIARFALAWAGILIASASAQDASIPIFGRNPPVSVTASGQAGSPLLIMDPMVLEDPSGYHLFYSTLFCKKPDGSFYYSWDPKNPNDCDLGQFVSAIGYAYSSDLGMTWKFRASPVFAPGANDWEKYKVETAYVIRVENELRLFYSALGYVNGQIFDNRYQLGVSFFDLGHRTIQDALLNTNDEFERRRSDPLIPFDTTKTSFFNNVQEPSVVYKDGRFELFFIGIGLARPEKSPCVGTAEECSGQSFTQFGLGRAILNTDLEILEITESPIPGTNWTLNMPEVRYRDGKYFMFSVGFGRGEVHQGEFVQRSTSPDGLVWSAPLPVVVPRGDARFDGWAATTPTAIVDGDGITLFYSAFGRQGVGRPCDLTQRWGISVSVGSPPTENDCIHITLGRAEADRSSLKE